MDQIIAETLVGIVRLIVDKPDEVKVQVISQGEALLFRLVVDKDDAGKVIGKQGRTARTLRTILTAMGQTASQTISLEIVE